GTAHPRRRGPDHKRRRLAAAGRPARHLVRRLARCPRLSPPERSPLPPGRPGSTRCFRDNADLAQYFWQVTDTVSGGPTASRLAGQLIVSFRHGKYNQTDTE